MLRVRLTAFLMATVACVAAQPASHAASYIDMGPAPLLGAYDQPFVRVEIHDQTDSFGPSSQSNYFLLDTGATSILAVGGAAADLRQSRGRFREGTFLEQGVGGFILYDVSAPYTVDVVGSGVPTLEAGDANQDLIFDQLDIVQVLQRGKYLTGRAANWGDGDWAQALGGSPGVPAQGDGRFDQKDIVAALQHGLYQQGPYATDTNGVGGIRRDAVRILSDPAQSFGEQVGFEGIVGMPAMVDRVTTLDLTPGASGGLSDVDLFDLDALIDALSTSGVSSSMGVSFSHTLPPGTGHRYGVPVRALHFDPDQPAPVPTAAPLPVVTASHHVNGQTVTGDSYIVDTGAQMSFISLDKVRQLGLDPEDPFSTLPIAGVGGTTDVPIFYVESLSLMTQEGIELYWSDVQVIGLDLDPSIDGVIGSDLLTAGLLDANLTSFDLDDLLSVGEGPLQQVHFDFRTLAQDTRDGTGMMYLDLNPDADVVREGPYQPQTAGELDLLEGLLDDDLLDLFGDLFDLSSIPGAADGSIFDATFGSRAGASEVAMLGPSGLSIEPGGDSPTAAGSLEGGADLAEVDLVHMPVPEPETIGLLILGLAAGLFPGRIARRG